MSSRSKLVQAGRMTSAIRVSLLNQMSWLTTNSSLGLWYMRTHLVVSRHGAHEGAAVAVEHLDLGAALSGIDEVLELLLERLAAEAGAVPARPAGRGWRPAR